MLNIINILENFSDAFIILEISCLSLLASGLYNEAFITGPTPDSNNVIYARNCVIEDTKPFTFDPKDVIIIFGTINP